MKKENIRFYLFFILLAAPVFTFPFMKQYVDCTNYENRALAEFPQISPQTLLSFSKQYDAYFSDHLPYKNQLAMLNTLKEESLGEGTTVIEYLQKSISVIRGKEGWLFYGTAFDEEESVNDYLCNNLYTEEELKEIASGYDMLQKKLKKMGTDLVVFYAANKEQVYPEYMPDSLVPGSYSRTDQLVDFIQQNTDVPLIYTKNALKKEKKNHTLFYKYDTHWNDLGGFVGRQLINEYFHGEYISLDQASYSVVSRNQSGDLAGLLSVKSRYSDDTVYQIKCDNMGAGCTLLEDGGDYYVFSSDAADRRSVLIIMDSFGDALMGMADDFAKVIFTKEENNMKQLLKKEKPDIVLLEIAERKKAAQETLCRKLSQCID